MYKEYIIYISRLAECCINQVRKDEQLVGKLYGKVFTFLHMLSSAVCLQMTNQLFTFFI